MKILHVINNLSIGGAEKLIVETLPRLRDEGFSVDLLVFNKVRSSFEVELLKNNINLYSLDVQNIYNPVIILKLRSYLKSYDVVHVHLFPAQYWVAISSLLLKKPPILITTEHNTDNRRRHIKLLRVVDKLIYRQYKSIIGISQATSEKLINYLSEGAKKNITINNGVDIDKYYKALPFDRKALELSRSDVILMMVAAFRIQKDQDTIIRALLHLPKNVKLVLVGDGERRKSCESLAKEIDVAERVFFLGRRSDIPALIQMSDICIVSSHWEGFGLVAVEGMAASKPVIASDVSGLSDIIKNYGLLFHKGDDKMLANLIVQLINYQDYYSEVSLKCLERAKDFDISKMINQLSRLYRNMLEGK